MKKTFVVLPLCLLFAFCSRKTVPPAPSGISNVTVGQGDSMVSASKASSSYSSSDRDWAYKSNPDTVLNGTWMLEGMQQSNGSWSTTEKATAATMSAGTMATTDTAVMAAGQGTAGKGKMAAGKKAKRNALYESAKSRLKMDYKAGSAMDTSALEPYAYWKRTPMINFTKGAFTGNTGCNNMSGSVNYTAANKDLQFSRNIITSKMACMDYDESNFLALLKKADTYNVSGNMLEIRQGTTVLMTFKRS